MKLPIPLITAITLNLALGLVPPVSAVHASEPEPLPELLSTGAARPVTLREAVQMALEKAEEIELVRIDYRKAIRAVQSQMGVFDPTLSAAYTYTNTDSISPNLFNLSSPIVKNKSHQLTFGLGGLIPTGATYDLSIVNERTRNASPFTTLVPQNSVRLAGTLRQPLLKNRGLSVTLTQLRIARGLEEGQKSVLLQRIQGTAYNVIRSYWDLVFRQKDLEAKLDSLKAAEDLVRVAENRVRVRVDPPIYLTQARAGAEIRREQVILAREQLELARDSLRQQVMLVESARELAEPEKFEPADSPAYVPFDPPYEESVRKAMDQRPEFVISRITRDNAKSQAVAAANGRWPELNATITGGLAGLSGTARPARPSDSPQTGAALQQLQNQWGGGMGSAWESALGADGPFFALGAEFRMPVPNQRARAANAQAQLDLDNAEIGLRKTEETVLMDVRRTIRSLQSSAQRIRSTELNVNLAQENVTAERRRYEVGISTSWDVLEREKELTEARAGYYRALADYNTARAAYELAVGTILEFVGIDVDVAGERT